MKLLNVHAEFTTELARPATGFWPGLRILRPGSRFGVEDTTLWRPQASCRA